jgi:uncharacterized protein (TIGR00156 family)
MKKYTIAIVCCFAALFATQVSVFAQGFTGPSAPGTAATTQAQYQAVSVSQVQTLPHNSRIILTGNIVRSVGRENYTFRDSTGEVTFEIERKYWRGLSVGPSDTVEIRATLEIDRDGRIEIEADAVRKL